MIPKEMMKLGFQLSRPSEVYLQRPNPSENVGGKYKRTYQDPVKVLVKMNPLDEEELNLMSDGDRKLEWQLAISLTEIRLKDRIYKTQQGKRYEVRRVSNWSEQGGFWKAFCVGVENA